MEKIVKKRCFICRRNRNILHMKPLNNYKQQYICKDKKICRLVVKYYPDPVPLALIFNALNKVVK
jgi:hypothetical protein